MAKDPVCGMDVDPKTAAGESEYQGRKYYFCSTGCKKAFDKEPRQYRPFAYSYSGYVALCYSEPHKVEYSP